MRLAVSLIILFLLLACNSNEQAQESPLSGMQVIIPNYMKEMKSIDKKGEKLVYYFDGACPICYTKVSNIREDKSLVKNQLLIWYTKDTAVANFNLKQLELDEFVIYDKNDSFHIQNPDIPLNTAVIIVQNNRVIEEYYP